MAGTTLDSYCQAHLQRFLDELCGFIRIPSISADPAYAREVARSAEFLAAAARQAGFTAAEVWPTAGHPAVFAERLVDPALPTVLVYGHHDVQPVDPLEQWQSPPFEAEVRDGKLYGRGAVDDKGQVWMHLKALETYLQVHGELPLNLKLIVEGEEESGSVNFETLVDSRRQRLAADVVVVSDTAMVARDVPSITVALRGLALIELEVQGPELDLHSGVFGGAVANPVEMMTRVISQLKDPASGRVLVPGFYDDVEDLTVAEREQLAAVPFDLDRFRDEAGHIPSTVGEAGFTPSEQRSIRPTLEINGIWGGYSGAGSKTIIPARAGAKISCRLVPHQDPDDIAGKVAAYIRQIAPAGVTLRVQGRPGGHPVVVPTNHPAVASAAAVIADICGRPPVFTREGGSIPAAEALQRLLGVPPLLIGVGLPDDQIHAPNEKFEVEQYHLGIRLMANLWHRLGTDLRAGGRA